MIRKILGLAVLGLMLPCTVLAQNQALTGTIRNASGTGLSGRLMIQLQRPALNTCNTPVRQASSLPVFTNVVNGTIQTINIVPSDCLSPFQTYYLELRSGTTLLWNGQYYITSQGGAAVDPATGSINFYASGLNDGNTGNPSVLYLVLPGGGFKIATVSTGVVPMGVPTPITVTWPQAFTSTAYTVSCVVINSGVGLMYPTTISSKTVRSLVVTVFTNSAGLTKTVVCRGRT